MEGVIPLVEHLGNLLQLAVILLGPVPFCLVLLLATEYQLRRLSFAHALLLVLTGWCALQIALSLLLLLLHQFTPGVILLAEAMIFFVGVVCLTYIERRTRLSSFSLLALPQHLNGLEILAIIVIVAVGLSLLWRGTTVPVRDHDALAFRLPLMARWYQTGSLAGLEQYPNHSRRPFHWEVLDTLFLTPFGEDFVVTLPNLAAWGLLGLSVYGLSTMLGASRTAGLAAAALLLLMPAIREHIVKPAVDVPLATFFAVVCYFAVLLSRTRSLAYGGWLFVALGLLAGIRQTGLVYGLLLVIVLAALDLPPLLLGKRAAGPSFLTPRSTLPLAIFGLVCFLWLSGFWYVRNLIEVGNPLGHVQVRIAGQAIFEGDLTSGRIYETTMLYLFDPGNAQHWKTFAEQVQAQLHLPFLVLLLLALAVPACFLPGQQKSARRSALLMLLLLGGTAALHIVSPFSGNLANLRYGFSFVAMIAVAAAVGATLLRLPDVLLVAFVVVAGGPALADVSQALLWLLQQERVLLILSGSVLIMGALFLTGRSTTGRRIPKGARALLPLASIVFLLTLTAISSAAAREERAVQRRQVYGSILDYIEVHVGREATIGYLLAASGYPLYGEWLDRDVVYVPATTPDRQRWLADLHERGITLLAAGPVPLGVDPNPTVGWLNDPQGPFIRVLGSDITRETVLYRFRGAPASPLPLEERKWKRLLALYKLKPGSLVRGEQGPAIYLLDDRLQKQWIVSPQTFQYCGWDWLSIQIIPDWLLERLETTPDMPACALEHGILLSDRQGKVYLLTNGRKRWVSSPEVLLRCGWRWDQVYTDLAGLLERLPDGPGIFYCPRAGDFVQSVVSPRVYLIDEQHRRRWITRPELFAICRWNPATIQIIPSWEIEVLEAGPDITDCVP